MNSKKQSKRISNTAAKQQAELKELKADALRQIARGLTASCDTKWGGSD